MDRRNFLAIIPSLSAIPFIGKNIVKKSDRIEIFQPEQMEQELHKSEECEVHIVKNGRVLCKGFIEGIDISYDQIETTCRDNGNARTYIQGAGTMRVTAFINPPKDLHDINALYDITSSSMRYNMISAIR